MQIEVSEIVKFLLAFFGGSGMGMVFVRLYIREEAKKALKEDLSTIKSSITDLKQEVSEAVKKMSEEYVTCKFCNLQHENLNTLLKCMDDKLDILIERQ